jgi:arginyl-tRNA synthetase
MPSLLDQLTAALAGAFAACGLDPALGVVRESDRPELCAFQCNGAFAAAKAARRPPKEVAEAVAAALIDSDTVQNVSVAGPGFINFDASRIAISSALAAQDNARCGVPATGAGTIIVDYGGPNPAKAMHAGHLRTTLIGDALKRIFAFAGYRALGNTHLNDLGLPMGQIISEYAARHPEWPYFDPAFTGPYPAEAPFTYAELEEIYPQAAQACKDDPARRNLARQAAVDLQEGRTGYRALWGHLMRLSKADAKRNFDSLGVSFELWRGEADVHGLIPGIGRDLKGRGLAVESEGALVVPVVEAGDTRPMPPLMYYKSDGAATYGTTDVATLCDRAQTYPDLVRAVYVADRRQALHFEQVFRTARLAGYADGVDLTFVGYGTMNGPDGRPFKTRSGGLPRFDDIVAETLERARARLAEAGLRGDEALARQIMMATLKFADLVNPPAADYVFDPERMTAFEGKTGPYVLYQAVRAGAILEKAGSAGALGPLGVDETPLALTLAAWPEAFAQALAAPSPHPVAAQAYRVAQAFSRFYGACPVLSEADPATRAARLALVARTRAQITLALSLLGIYVPKQM